MDAPAAERIDYIELPATDLAATKAFYTSAFGWPFVDYGPTYAATGSDGECPEVALSATATAAPMHEPQAQDAIGPLVLFSTADLQAVLTRITAAGGTIVSEPMTTQVVSDSTLLIPAATCSACTSQPPSTSKEAER